MQFVVCVASHTGILAAWPKLKAVVNREVVDQVDHRNMNVEVPFMKGLIPTTENIVVAIWKVLAPAVAPAKLEKIVLWETENNAAEYRGE